MTADLSPDEAATLARFEAAGDAPESFDAVAALRRVLKLADTFEAQDYEQWFGDEAAAAVRHAVRGDL